MQDKAGKTAKEKWAEERDRLYAVLEATSDGIALFDREGRLLLANLTFRKFFGLIPEGLAHEDSAATLEFLRSRAKSPSEFERSFRGLLLHPETTDRDAIELKLPYPRVLLRMRTPVRDETGSRGRARAYPSGCDHGAGGRADEVGVRLNRLA